jgi:type IV secretory pathway VirB10-like protein
MSGREDIVRGIRFGFILLATLLVVYAVYRVVREPAGAVDPRPTKVSGPPSRTAAPPSAHDADGPSLPPPPPRPGKVSRPKPAQSIITEIAPKPTPIREEAAAADSNSEPATAVEEENKEAPLQTGDVAEPQRAADESTSRPEPRSKRLLKAVGRFLHISGRKDPQLSVRQP